MKVCYACILLAGALTFFSCNKEEPVGTDPSLEIQAYLDSLSIVPDVSEGGIYGIRNSVSPGSASGDIVSFYYQLRFFLGEEISTVDSGSTSPVVARRGANSIFPVGLDKALTFMGEGENWTFIMEPAMAYGTGSSFSNIPAGAVVQFDIYLADVRGDNEVKTEEAQQMVAYMQAEGWYDTAAYPGEYPQLLPSGIAYKRMVQGSGPQPVAEQKITIDYAGAFLDKTSFGSRSGFVFFQGEGKVIPGLEIAVSSMNQGERALFIVPSEWAYRESAVAVPDFLMADLIEGQRIPAYAASVRPYRVVLFEITLTGVE